MISEVMPDAYSRRPVRTLGACWMVYGVIELITVVWLISVHDTVNLMFGALLSRVPDPFTLMDLFHFLYAAAIVLAAISGVCGIVTGWVLLQGLWFARTVALIAAVVSLLRVPLGTSLGIVTLVMLLPLSNCYATAARVNDRASDPKNRLSREGAARAG